MLKIKIFSPGKTKESWLLEALAEYEKRLTGSIVIEWDHSDKEPDTPYICLDPEGKLLSSEDFSKFLFKAWEQGGSRLSIVIGGPEGLSSEILKKASSIISLSKLTFTHQITRLVLLEQVYRALQIQKGSPYHK